MATVTIEQAFQTALGHHRAGRLAEAEAVYRQILAVQPHHADALHLLGVIAQQVGHPDAAIELIAKAIAAVPDYSDAHNSLGNALKDKGRLDEAVAAYYRAIALRPDYAEAYYNLGGALHCHGRLEEAVAAYRQAIIVRPDYPEAYYNLGGVMQEMGLADAAVAAYRHAIAIRPGYVEAHGNLGNALKSAGRVDEAIAAYEQAVAVSPGFGEAHYNLALALLLGGVFGRGWEEYEWRWKVRYFAPAWRNFAQPQWDGAPLEGRAILLHAEQGFGDTMQFIRYLPMVRECGGKIILECQPELQRILQGMLPGLAVISKGQPLPAFEVHCPLMSLPRIFATDLTNIPHDVPYLSANLAGAEAWRERLACAASGLKVGIVWAGHRGHTNDRNRSLSLAALAPLAGVFGVRFFSLQKGDAASESHHPPPGMELTDVGQDLNDFADTAALIANLDLVIAVDTAVVHLAGAMGRPVWTLLPFVPDWRWLLGREDSPWYPTMRLFRQPEAGDWESVIRRVAEELRVLQAAMGN